MKGHGISYGAISVLNAIPCGIGSTIGINLRTEAEFSESDVTEISLIDRPNTSTDLVSVCVRRTLETIGAEQTDYQLTVKSQIPSSMGLKSSSSVCNAVISAVLDAYHEKMEPIDLIRLGVRCARECRVTITGAFDDACGCGLGGLVITDNRSDELLYRADIPRYDVVLCIPKTSIPKSKVPIEKYKSLSEKYMELSESIKDDYLNVLTQNGSYVNEIVGNYSINPELALINGALAAGVTGTGPAVAAIAEKGNGRKIAEAIGCKTIVTETR